jgi:hypothetical protein
MLQRRPFVIGSLLGFLLLLAACGQGQLMTPAEIDQNGTRVFQAPPAKVFVASVAALRSQGYEIAAADPAKGSIVTKPKLVSAIATGDANQAQAVGILRRYRLSLTPSGAGTKVRVEPGAFQGTADISAHEVWVLDGPGGERAQWSQLFQEIQANL